MFSAEWLPTPENINALPAPIRKYIHDLETCAPTELVQENHELRQNFEGVKALYFNLRLASCYGCKWHAQQGDEGI